MYTSSVNYLVQEFVEIAKEGDDVVSIKPVDLADKYTVDASHIEKALEESALRPIKAVTYTSGKRGVKEIFYTEALVTIPQGVLTLGTTYGQRPSQVKLHPSASHYLLDGKVTDELKEVQRKGILPAAKYLATLYKLDEKELVNILTTSRNLEQYK